MVHLSMGVSDMKKFLINIAIFFAIVAIVDVSLGMAFHYLQAHAGGRTGAEYYVCEKATEDVIIMGSSRASHHYVPEIISEKLGMTCFNAGQDGNGIILQYGRWKMLSERYTPKLIIYDISTEFDLAENDNMAYVDRLKPFAYYDAVRNYVADIFPMEKLKLFSKLYCYNYKFIEMFSDCRQKDDKVSKTGYIPLYGHIRDEIVKKERVASNVVIRQNFEKAYYLEQLVKETKIAGTKLIFVVSPYWRGYGYGKKTYSLIAELSKRYDAPFIEYVNSDIFNNPDYFEDSHHLNDCGARVFTNDVCKRIAGKI